MPGVPPQLREQISVSGVTHEDGLSDRSLRDNVSKSQGTEAS